MSCFNCLLLKAKPAENSIPVFHQKDKRGVLDPCSL